MNDHVLNEPLLGKNRFLADPDAWDRDIAQRIADQLDIGVLQPAHWKVIAFLRQHYLDFGSLPWEAHVCRRLDLHEQCIRRLFGGPYEAWQVAGLPDPGEEART